MKKDYQKGRGAQFNTKNRFQTRQYESDEALAPADDFPEPVVRTHYFTEFSKQIISRNQSSDIPNATSVNPYQGCEHGCIYGYARPTHEYWGFPAGLDFESKIMVKKNAPALLEKQFLTKTYQPAVIHLSGSSDCYHPPSETFN